MVVFSRSGLDGPGPRSTPLGTSTAKTTYDTNAKVRPQAAFPPTSPPPGQAPPRNEEHGRSSRTSSTAKPAPEQQCPAAALAAATAARTCCRQRKFQTAPSCGGYVRQGQFRHLLPRLQAARAADEQVEAGRTRASSTPSTAAQLAIAQSRPQLFGKSMRAVTEPASTGNGLRYPGVSTAIGVG